jgi:hypothetical protein
MCPLELDGLGVSKADWPKATRRNSGLAVPQMDGDEAGT